MRSYARTLSITFPKRKQAFDPQVLGRFQKVNTFIFWSCVQGHTASATVRSNMGWKHWQWMCFSCMYVDCFKHVLFCSQNQFHQELFFWCLENLPCHGIQGVLLSTFGFAFWGGFPHRFPSFETGCCHRPPMAWTTMLLLCVALSCHDTEMQITPSRL